MRKEQVVAVILAHEPGLRARGVESLAIFGSVARGDAGPDSDIDLLVDLAPWVDVFQFVALKEWAEAILGCRVDLVPRRALKARLRDAILADAEPVLAA